MNRLHLARKRSSEKPREKESCRPSFSSIQSTSHEIRRLEESVRKKEESSAGLRQGGVKIRMEQWVEDDKET